MGGWGRGGVGRLTEAQGEVGGVEHDEGEGGEQEGFGKPEGAGRIAVGDDRSEGGPAEERETDEGELAEFCAAKLAAGWAGGGKGFEEAFGDVAEIAGDEGGVVGEAADAAVGGDLEGRDEGDGACEGELGRGEREQADEEEGDDLGREGEDRCVTGGRGGEQAGGDDSDEKGKDGGDVAEDVGPVAAHGGDAEEDDVAGHGVGEDVAVAEIDDGVEEAAGGGEKHGGGERGGFEAGGWRHGRVLAAINSTIGRNGFGRLCYVFARTRQS